MKATKRLFALACCAICAMLMCTVLAACGSGASAGKDMVGYWEVTSGKTSGEELSAKDVEFMKSIDVRLILHLDKDGKATIDMFGTVEDLTWDVNKATMSYGGATGTFTLSGDTLTYGDGGSNELVFKKGDDSLATKIETDRKSMEEGKAGTTTETKRVAIDPPVTIADDQNATITAVARVVDENGMGGIEFSITNKTSERFASHTLQGATVNGSTYEIYYYAEVKAGETVNEVAAFDGVKSIDELKGIHFTLTIYETTAFNDLGVYEVNID